MYTNQYIYQYWRHKFTVGHVVAFCQQLSWTHYLLLFMCRGSGAGLPPFPSLHHQELPQQRDLRGEPAERTAGAQLPREVERSVQI